MPDTIHALGEWDRCVRDGGVLFFIVPHKERTFDRLRPRTALQHHLADYAERMTVDSDPLVPTSHYHVWITEDFVALIEFLNAQGFLDWEILEVEDVDSKVGNGFTVVARKRRTVERTADGDRGGVEGPIAFHQLTRAFPFRVIDHSLERIALGPELPQQIDAPHGVYRVLPIHEGFPPRAGPAFELQIGDEVDAPVIEAVELVDGKAVFHGHALTESTWLEATYPDGTVHQVLPAYADGRLALSVEGLVLPAGGFPIVPVTPAPGGGRGPTFSAWTWDSLE